MKSRRSFLRQRSITEFWKMEKSQKGSKHDSDDDDDDGPQSLSQISNSSDTTIIYECNAPSPPVPLFDSDSVVTPKIDFSFSMCASNCKTQIKILNNVNLTPKRKSISNERNNNSEQVSSTPRRRRNLSSRQIRRIPAKPPSREMRSGKENISTDYESESVDDEDPSTSRINNPVVSKTIQRTEETPSTSQITPTKSVLSNNRIYTTPQELDKIKPKDGKRLQTKHLNELVKLIQMVQDNPHFRDLLSDEQELLKKFENLNEVSKYFVMKLFVWKKEWYNVFKFCTKAQIQISSDGDIVRVFRNLIEGQIVEEDYQQKSDVINLLQQLDLKNIREITSELRINRKNATTKEGLIDAILNAMKHQPTLSVSTKSFNEVLMGKIQNKLGVAIRLRDDMYQALRKVYILATISNPIFMDIQEYFRQMVYEKITFPPANLQSCIIFYSKDEFRHYFKAVQMQSILDEVLEYRDKDNKVLRIHEITTAAWEALTQLRDDDKTSHTETPHLKRFRASHVYSKIITTGCEHLYTKSRHPEDVKLWLQYLIDRFPHSTIVGKWYHRLVWLHMSHLDVNFQIATECLIKALKNDSRGQIVLDDRSRYELGILGRKLRNTKKYKLDQLARDRVGMYLPEESVDPKKEFSNIQIDSPCIRSNASGRKRRYYAKEEEDVLIKSVEQVALDHYGRNGFPDGKHDEGGTIKALLPLFFWDIIYNPEKVVPGSFISELQSVPLDFHTKYFYENRQEAIDKRLEEIDQDWTIDQLIAFAKNNWQNHCHEYSLYGITMDTIKKPEDIGDLVQVITRKTLSRIFERIVKGSYIFNSGMPDLLVWNSTTNSHKFVEVKGENDKLASHQLMWLKYLKDVGANVEVCWVHSIGSKRKKIN